MRILTCFMPPPDGHLGHAQAVGIFHIAQEALNNISKHSQATLVSIKLVSSYQSVELEIEDNGHGFETASAGSQGKQGLRNMKERARSLGAHLDIDSEKGRGTAVRLALPLSQKENVAGE
jgi:signal transduction histidine kinase